MKERQRPTTENIYNESKCDVSETKKTFKDPKTDHLKSTNNWLTFMTILMVASIVINIFLYSISIKQRTEILNLQDTLEERDRVIQQYKTKNNE